jgi:DNA-binding transcriptional ArsR family regulator
MSLLPSGFDPSAGEDAEPRVVGVESDEADEILAALSSTTARRLLSELHDRPGPPADLADRVDTSIQNAQYHLGKLEDAGAIAVVDTAYSEKGREMDVYAPADQPLVIFAGDEEEGALRTALSRLLRAVGVVGLASVLVQSLFGEAPFPGTDTGGEDAAGDGAATDGGDGTVEEGTEDAAGDGAVPEEEAAEETPDAGAEDAVDGLWDALVDGLTDAADALASLPPGVLFFLAGTLLCVVVVAALYYRDVSRR